MARTDAALLLAARTDPAAFRELYERYAEALHGFHLRRTGDADAAYRRGRPPRALGAPRGQGTEGNGPGPGATVRSLRQSCGGAARFARPSQHSRGRQGGGAGNSRISRLS
jgi:hypothetical protein